MMQTMEVYQSQKSRRPRRREAELTVAKLCRDWLGENEKRLKPSTYVKYSNMMERHILPRLGSRSAHTLSRRDLEEFTEQLSRRGRLDGKGGLAEKTVRDIVKLLNCVYKDARQRELTGNGLVFDSLRMGKAKRQVEVLERGACQALEKGLGDSRDPARLGVLLAMYTGLRIGELCALRWTDIDTECGTLRVRATMQRLQDVKGETGRKTNVICTLPKSPSSLRTIPLPDGVADRLKELAPENREAYFLTGSTGQFLEPRAYTYRFQKYLRECGVRQVNFHVLRHTFATRCVEVGFDTKSLSEILGHASVNITMELYVHPTMEHKRENMNKLNFR